jgi:hypothetical protein
MATWDKNRPASAEAWNIADGRIRDNFDFLEQSLKLVSTFAINPSDPTNLPAIKVSFGVLASRPVTTVAAQTGMLYFATDTFQIFLCTVGASNTWIAATVPGLGTAAFLNTGTGVGTIPLNTFAAALTSAAYATIGNTVGNLVVHAFTGPLLALAYRATPAHLFTTKQSDQAYSGTAEVTVTDLVGIAIPGTPDGVKKYRVSGRLSLISTAAVNATVQIRMGTLGTIADAPILAALDSPAGVGSGGEGIAIPVFEIQPLANTKLTMTYQATPNHAQTINGAGIVPVETYLTIEEIL